MMMPGTIVYSSPVQAGMPIYYSAGDPSMPMPMVTAEQVASAKPMPAEMIATYCPGGVPMGFTPMLVGEGGFVAPQVSLPTATEGPKVTMDATAGEKPSGKKEKKDKSKKSKKK